MPTVPQARESSAGPQPTQAELLIAQAGWAEDLHRFGGKSSLKFFMEGEPGKSRMKQQQKSATDIQDAVRGRKALDAEEENLYTLSPKELRARGMK